MRIRSRSLGALIDRLRRTAPRAAVPPDPPQRRRRIVAGALGLALLGAIAGTGYDYRSAEPDSAPSGADAAEGQAPAELIKQQRKLRAAIERHAPRGAYIVVDRSNNRLYLRRGEALRLEAIISVGSGSILSDPTGGRQWIFDTPPGAFRVLNKIEDPVWRKPDWAFIEEGLEVPSDPGDRIEYGVLGEYGLYFGDGYLIHGTLYERLLGRSVSHGCVRVGRDDLRALYRAVKIGTPIYIF